MGGLLQGRFRQGVFEALSSMNRAQGSGGGAGIISLPQLGYGSDAAASTITSGTYTVVPGVTTTFAVSRPTVILVHIASIGKTSGAGGTFAYGTVHIDGKRFSLAEGGMDALWDKNTGGYGCNGFWLTTQASTGATGIGPFLQAGQHTVDFRVLVDTGQTWINYETALYVFQGT